MWVVVELVVVTVSDPSPKSHVQLFTDPPDDDDAWKDICVFTSAMSGLTVIDIPGRFCRKNGKG